MRAFSQVPTATETKMFAHFFVSATAVENAAEVLDKFAQRWKCKRVYIDDGMNIYQESFYRRDPAGLYIFSRGLPPFLRQYARAAPGAIPTIFNIPIPRGNRVSLIIPASKCPPWISMVVNESPAREVIAVACDRTIYLTPDLMTSPFEDLPKVLEIILKKLDKTRKFIDTQLTAATATPDRLLSGLLNLTSKYFDEYERLIDLQLAARSLEKEVVRMRQTAMNAAVKIAKELLAILNQGHPLIADLHLRAGYVSVYTHPLIARIWGDGTRYCPLGPFELIIVPTVMAAVADAKLRHVRFPRRTVIMSEDLSYFTFPEMEISEALGAGQCRVMLQLLFQHLQNLPESECNFDDFEVLSEAELLAKCPTVDLKNLRL